MHLRLCFIIISWLLNGAHHHPGTTNLLQPLRPIMNSTFIKIKNYSEQPVELYFIIGTV